MKKLYVALFSFLTIGAFAQNNAQLNLSDSKGTQSSAQVVVTPGVEDLDQEKVIDIYTYNNHVFVNPINFGNVQGSVSVFDLGGKMISTSTLNNELTQIALPNAGIYIVTVQANGEVFTEKVFLR